MAITSGMVLVTPSELQAAAEKAHARITDCDAMLERINSIVSASESFWLGQGGEAAREACSGAIKSARVALEDFREYPKDLLAYQGLYSEVIAQTEARAKEITEFNLS
ncbi:MAG: hypothetical protein IJ125_02365 [Atopobiaceae bacterium]|nr:hypothetical protein [Atopobiaceae bacterium]